MTQERRPITSIQSEVFRIFSKANKAVGLENQTRETISSCVESMELLKNRLDFDSPEYENALHELMKDYASSRTQELKDLLLPEIFIKAKQLYAKNKRLWDSLGYFTEEEMQVMNVTLGVDGKPEGLSPAVPKEFKKQLMDDEDETEAEQFAPDEE